MDYTTRYPSRSNSDPSTTIYTGEADYQHNFKAHWLNSMYSTQHLDSPNKQLLRGALDGNERNYNISRMYSTKQSLSADNINNQPKRESMWQSLTKSATNFLGEHLTRGTGSFFKNWSSMNSPLSVTVVSPDFYKSLQAGKDHQLVNPCEGLYSKNRTWSKDSQSSDNSLPNVLYNNEITSDKKSSSDSNDSDQRWNEYKNMYVFNGEQEKNLITDTKIVNSVNKNDFTNETMESHFNVIIDDEKDKSTNFGNTFRVDDEPVMIEKPEYSEAQQQLQEQQQQQQIAQSQPQRTTVQPTAMGTLLTNAYNKVVSGVVDLLTQRSASPEPVSDSLFLKRACSPKLRPKKVHNISSGRGRGRAKSQLRRSGVSQKRHRKERSRYDRSDDIKSDIDNWEEIDYCTSDDEECDAEGVDVCDFGGKHFENHASGFTLADVHPEKRKPKKGKNRGWTQVSVSISLQGLDTDGDIKHPFRQRLLSESSVESDDSYCIIFEDDDDDCSEDEDYENKRKSCLESETESETKSEDEVIHVEVHPTKVRFDPTPTIYPMIHWNYAYRAARRGPWEEMGRDRERFRGRIHCIGRILEPVLSKQHRMQVWHERFED